MKSYYICIQLLYLKSYLHDNSNKNFLIDFVTETTKQGIQVVSINNKELLDEMKYKICVKIKNRDELDKLISKIKMIKDTKVL